MDVQPVSIVQPESMTASANGLNQLEPEEDGRQEFFRSSYAVPVCLVILHDYCGQVDIATIARPTHCVASCQTDCVTADAAVQTGPIILMPLSIPITTGTQTDASMRHSPLRFEHISDSDENVRNFTGMPNAATFHTLFSELPTIEDNEMSCKKSLRLIDQFLITLVRLKLGLVLADLSFRFSVSTATCSRIINKWIDHLHVHLSFLIYWPTRNQIDNSMPEDFAVKFPKTRVVIDCTELFTQTSQSLADQSLMYSHYKSHMTWKALVGITPNGVVSFVSDLWAGSVSDKQLVERSNILQLCEEGDAIMADKGF